MKQVTRFGRGFSLIELAVVLIIIGLITGGIIVGQSALRGSQVQSVVSDISTYSNAITQFSQKYNALPGDMATAQTLWGSNSTATPLATCSLSTTTLTSSQSTCNGNGDGHIDGCGAAAATANEGVVAWKHLLNAGLIQGKLSGRDNGATGTILVGTDVPRSRVNSAGFSIANTSSFGAPTGSPNNYAWGTASYQHVIEFGISDGSCTLAPALTTAEALSIDAKIDDGKPGTGAVVTPIKSGNSNWGANCANNTDPSVAVYATNLTGLQCSLFFELGY